MQSMRRKFTLGALAICLLSANGSAMADDEALCDALEQARDPLYEVPMGEEDWHRIDALENAARAMDCTFVINN